MKPKQTIRQKLEERSNDYSFSEPFEDSTPIKSSIIIPVYNNQNVFRRTLSSIANHPTVRYLPNQFEIVVVNDGSIEDVGSIVKQIKFPCKIKYYSSPKNEGRSAARNNGIGLASNDLYFFFDSDVVIPKNYFLEMWKIHNSLPNAVSVGMAENVYSDETRGFDEMPNIRNDFRYHKTFKKERDGRTEYHLILETDWFKQFGNGKKIGFWTLPGMTVANNLGVRKNLVEQVGGFDERFKTWGYEDNNFGAKLIASEGYVIPSKNTGVWRIVNRDQSRIFSDENRELYERLLDEII